MGSGGSPVEDPLSFVHIFQNECSIMRVQPAERRFVLSPASTTLTEATHTHEVRGAPDGARIISSESTTVIQSTHRVDIRPNEDGVS